MAQQPAPQNILAGLSAPVFLGMAPIFGKLAFQAGAEPFTVAAVRTGIAVLLLWVVYLIFWRKYIYIYPAGLMGCVVIGAVNGIGSLFYYSGLDHLEDASLAQLLNGTYMAFAVLISLVAGQKADFRTFVRVSIALIALVLLTDLGSPSINWLGVGLMLGNALMFAGTLILGQYVVYEMPAPTATLYILTTMGVLVGMVWLVVGEPLTGAAINAALPPIFVLGITTALARLAMFAGVKFMGGMQMAILAITEIAVALILAAVVLQEDLTRTQWVGVAVLFVGMLLIRRDDLLPRGFNPNALIAANMSSVQFQRIAFQRAFGKAAMDAEQGDIGPITTQEMIAIQKMMGASSDSFDPYPIGKARRHPPESSAD